MDAGQEKEVLQQMREWVNELVNSCQDLALLDLIYKILLLQ